MKTIFWACWLLVCGLPILAAEDGTQIVFIATRTGAEMIYSMNPDGTGMRRLNDQPSPPAHAASTKLS